MKNDPLVFGSLAGLVGNIAKELITWSLYGLGLVKYTFAHLCAGLVVSSNLVKSPLALILGFLFDYTIAAGFGMLAYYLLKIIGTRLILIKGIVIGVGVFLICFCILRAEFTSIKGFVEPLDGLIYLISNLTFGLTTTIFIKKYDRTVKS